MTRNRDSGKRSGQQRQLIKTTKKVAGVLSADFGIRSGYEVVESNSRAPDTALVPPAPTIAADTEAAVALRAFFFKQNGRQTTISGQRELQMLSVSDQVLDGVGVGDVVEVATAPSLTKRLLLVLKRSTRMITCAKIVSGQETLLHDVLAANELFLVSGETTITVKIKDVTAKIDPKSIVLRSAWDGKQPAFVGLNQWAAQLGTDKPQTKEVVFHEGDFLMLPPKDNGPLLDIVQVHRVRSLAIVVRRLHRQASQPTAIFKHDRLLIPAAELDRIEKALFKPIATCNVSLLTADKASSWTMDTTDFFVTAQDASLLRPECAPCTTAHRDKRRAKRDLAPLTAMELMCGAGGLSLGLDLSGACETKFAIDADEDSTKTFKRHHPSAKVFCADAGVALQRALVRRKSLEEGLDFPRPGEVDVMSAGPPCQGFSRMNQTACREKAEQDPRNLLVATVLGWVDYLRPKYFILENVEGFTAAKLGGHEKGMVKFVMKSLMVLGYARTCGYVQSGSFGCAQSRKRFILIAAKEGLTLPTMPVPTHTFLGRMAHRFSWTDGHGNAHTTETSGSAAILPAVTVADAIYDLPVFDWQDPHQIYAGPDAIELQRTQLGIPQLTVTKGSAVGQASTPYRVDPQNSIQERMRVLGGQTAKTVTQHQTCAPSPMLVERVVNVALFAGANYDSWSQPCVNKPNLLCKSLTECWQDDHFKFERLDGLGYFKALMTTITAHGSMIHPKQRRLLTVRECARAQGFPDWVHFETNENLSSAHRQIGNAVPIPLGQALGKALIAARLKDTA